MEPLVVIVMGSKSDLEHARGIEKALSELGLPCELRVASAHKSPRHLLQLLSEYEADLRPSTLSQPGPTACEQDLPLVYIAVAGRSNALGGLIDAQTACPVINCPPYSEKYGGMDILSSLRMPSGVACVTVLEPKAAALAAAKILALTDQELTQRLRTYQSTLETTIIHDDEKVRSAPRIPPLSTE